MPILQLSLPEELYALVIGRKKDDESAQATIRRLLKEIV